MSTSASVRTPPQLTIPTGGLGLTASGVAYIMAQKISIGAIIGLA